MPPRAVLTFALVALALPVAGTFCVRNPVDDPKAACDGEPFGEAYMHRVIESLAQPAWAGRRFDSVGLEEATRWVAAEFRCIGLTPGVRALSGLPSDTFEQRFETDGDEIEPTTEISGYTYDAAKKYAFTNVLGSIPGRGALAAEAVVIGAHIDHMGKYGAENDAVLLGADDDASGVLGLLSIAKQLLAEDDIAERRTIVFAAWAVEEDPFYLRGSKAFFRAMDASAKEKVVHYVNLDMIGGYRYHSNVNVLGTYAGSPARAIVDRLAPSFPGLVIEVGDPGSSSDHVTFCENGIPYAFFWTQDDCYHKPCDTADAIDYEHLAPILRLATGLVMGLATEGDLATARKGFAAAAAAAWPGKTCASQD